jgi:hypothetical protein
MRALILFHLKAGVRIAVQSFTPLFSGALIMIMISMYPVELVRNLARSLFAADLTLAAALPFAAVALLLPSIAAARLVHGLNGWMRHLPFSSIGNRTGLALALLAVQTPLAVSLALLACVAYDQNISVIAPLCRFLPALAAGAQVALPVRRAVVVAPLSAAAGGLILFGSWWQVTLAVGTLICLHVFAGPLREQRRSTPRRPTGSMLNLRIVWRALGWRILGSYAAGLIVIFMLWLFVSNNPMPAALQSAAVRFGAGMAIVIFQSSFAHPLAVRRPVWPWARSLPWSSTHRTASDALLLLLHSLPLPAIAAMVDGRAAAAAVATVPFLSLRSATHIRRIPEKRNGATVLLLEGFTLCALSAICWWLWIPALAAIPLAARSAAATESRQKVTRWLELHHTAAGDPLSWSA